MRTRRKGEDKQRSKKVLEDFLASRREGISPSTIRDYRVTLSKALPELGLSPTTEQINRYPRSLKCSLGGKFG